MEDNRIATFTPTAPLLTHRCATLAEVADGTIRVPSSEEGGPEVLLHLRDGDGVVRAVGAVPVQRPAQDLDRLLRLPGIPRHDAEHPPILLRLRLNGVATERSPLNLS